MTGPEIGSTMVAAAGSGAPAPPSRWWKMLLGRVTGTVVASQKEPLMEGWKLLVVRQLDAENREIRRPSMVDILFSGKNSLI